jgi:hypothetical protein
MHRIIERGSSGNDEEKESGSDHLENTRNPKAIMSGDEDRHTVNESFRFNDRQIPPASRWSQALPRP